MAKLKWKRLSYRELFVGIARCHENVHSLVTAAQYLYSKGFYASAVFQTILAMEEQGRKLVLYVAYIDGIELDEKCWRIIFRDHRSKIALLAIGYFSTLGKRKWMKTLRRVGSEYQALKERAMYVDFEVERNHWTHPGRISQKKALSVLREAKLFLFATDKIMVD